MSLPFAQWCNRVLRLTLTVGQAVVCALAFDGIQPRELPPEQQAIAFEMLGSLDDISDEAREQIIIRCGRGSGKSTISAAASLKRMCEADLSQVGPGDIAAALVIGVGKDGGEDTLNKARALAKQSTFASRICRDKGNVFHIKRADGREVRFQVIAASAKGKAGRGKSIIQVIIDESEFVASSDPSKVVRDVDIVNSVIPRMIEGAKLILASTPWPGESYTSEQFEANWNAPTTALAFKATTLVMRDRDPFWVSKVEKELKRDRPNAEREYLCMVGAAEGCWFEAETVTRSVSNDITATRRKSSAGIDLAFRSDASGIVIGERQDVLKVVDVEMDEPTDSMPLKPSVIGAKYAKKAKSFRCTELTADSHYIESARESADAEGLQVASGPSLTGDKEKSFVYARDLFRNELIKIPNNPKFVAQLKSVRVVYQSGGTIKIVLPKRPGSGHCDLVSAFVNMCWIDRLKYGPLITPKIDNDTDSKMTPSFVARRAGNSFSKGSAFG